MNEKFAHTPGPWHYVYTRIGHTVRQSPDAMRALLVVNVSENPEKDARLIAAAPELLEALTALVDDMSQERIPNRLWVAARAAIAKATGKTSEAA